MSPTILALFSDSGLRYRSHMRRDGRKTGRVSYGVHRCRPAFYRHGCGWQRLWERP
jgi:G:T-mismatch repair DNA endonuclease (very short patch repair protein)